MLSPALAMTVSCVPGATASTNEKSLPAADAGIYVTLSLAVTFPFNILLGIPLYVHVAHRFLA